jgi:hypothetical protein
MKKEHLDVLESIIEKMGFYKNKVISSEREKLQEVFDYYLQEYEENKHKNEDKKKDKKGVSFGGYNLSVEIPRIVTSLTRVSVQKEKAEEEIELHNQSIQDILHVFELLELTEEELIEYGQQLTDIRKQRRIAKDFVDLSKPLCEFVMKNKSSIEDLKKLQGTLQKDMDAKEKRTYTPRRLYDLKGKFNGTE